MPTRIRYSTSAIATWTRAVIRMPTTAITSITSPAAVAMPTLGQVLVADDPAIASTDGPRTTTPLSVPTMKPTIISHPVRNPR
jgi:hypothetical protein